MTDRYLSVRRHCVRDSFEGLSSKWLREIVAVNCANYVLGTFFRAVAQLHCCSLLSHRVCRMLLIGAMAILSLRQIASASTTFLTQWIWRISCVVFLNGGKYFTRFWCCYHPIVRKYRQWSDLLPCMYSVFCIVVRLMRIAKAIRNISQSELGVILSHPPCEMFVVISNQFVRASMLFRQKGMQSEIFVIEWTWLALVHIRQCTPFYIPFLQS